MDNLKVTVEDIEKIRNHYRHNKPYLVPLELKELIQSKNITDCGIIVNNEIYYQREEETGIYAKYDFSKLSFTARSP